MILLFITPLAEEDGGPQAEEVVHLVPSLEILWAQTITREPLALGRQSLKGIKDYMCYTCVTLPSTPPAL